MTLKKITDAILKILQVEASDRAAILPTLLDSLNEVRKEAEGLQDFKLSEKFGYLTVPTGGASWLTMKPSFSNGAPTGTDFSVKSMKHTLIYCASSAEWAKAIQRDSEKVLTARAESSFSQGCPYTQPFQGRNLVLRTGQTLEVEGATDTQYLKILCSSWIADWEDAEDETENPDFFVQHCYSYLKWATILSLNKVEQTFVMRAEGNLTEQSLRTQVERAWEAILLWDGFMHEGADSGIME